MKSGRAFKEVIEDALRLAFKDPESPQNKRMRLPESKASPGVQPGVDLDDSAALLDTMES